MAEADRQISSLRKILHVTRQMAVITDLDELLGMIVDATCQVLDCERATIFLYDSKTNELFSRVASEAQSIRFPADRGIAGTAARERKCVSVPDAYADARFNREVDARTGFRTRNLLTIPMENLGSQLIGVLQALNRRGRPFDTEDEDLACVLGAQAGVALERARLLTEYALKQRMARDLDIAREIQQELFPKENPSLPGYDIAGWNRSADETGGDCYDFLPLDDGRLGIFLADATGHGIAAALIIAQCRSLLRAMLSFTQDLGKITHAVNRLLCQDLASDRFVTAFIGILDPAAHRLDFVSAGQAPLLFFAGGCVSSREATTIPLGIMPDPPFDPPASFDLAPQDAVALLTDGFYEASSPNGELFGEQRVCEALQQTHGKSCSEAINRLHDAVNQFVAGGVQADDLTAVLIRRTS